ncbi:Pkinase-domain-containing protein [Salix suchowensis]|nr:Pkinase-domain-containing protein [Salix suchowensis]
MDLTAIGYLQIIPSSSNGVDAVNFRQLKESRSLHFEDQILSMASSTPGTPGEEGGSPTQTGDLFGAFSSVTLHHDGRVDEGMGRGRRGVWSTRKSREMRATGNRSGCEGGDSHWSGIWIWRPIWGTAISLSTSRSRERQLGLRDKERDAEKGLAQTVGFWIAAGLHGLGAEIDWEPYMGIAGIMDKIVDLVQNLRTNGPSAFFHRPPPLTPFYKLYVQLALPSLLSLLFLQPPPSPHGRPIPSLLVPAAPPRVPPDLHVVAPRLLTAHVRPPLRLIQQFGRIASRPATDALKTAAADPQGPQQNQKTESKPQATFLTKLYA